VSVEVLDDVATADSFGAGASEQDKSGLAHNPVADRSIELWKTLHNWTDAVRNGGLTRDRRFVLYVAQNHHGKVIDRISSVQSHSSGVDLVRALRDEFWGSSPKRAKKGSLPEGLAEHVNPVLSSSEDALAWLFLGITLENAADNPNDDLLPLIKQKAISAEAADEVLHVLLGWVKRSLDRKIEKRLPAIISFEEFSKQLVGAAKKLDRSTNVLVSKPLAITPAEVDLELRERNYVRQLRFILVDDSGIRRAVNDFLRAGSDRTDWSESGDVLEDSFHEFESGLQRAWESHKARVDVENKTETPENRGLLLHSHCMTSQFRLQGMDLPSHFIPGSFYTLSDELSIGWHPEYRERLGLENEVADRRLIEPKPI
jgi:hypothetical protein